MIWIWFFFFCCCFHHGVFLLLQKLLSINTARLTHFIPKHSNFLEKNFLARCFIIRCKSWFGPLFATVGISHPIAYLRSKILCTTPQDYPVKRQRYLIFSKFCSWNKIHHQLCSKNFELFKIPALALLDVPSFPPNKYLKISYFFIYQRFQQLSIF